MGDAPRVGNEPRGQSRLGIWKPTFIEPHFPNARFGLRSTAMGPTQVIGFALSDCGYWEAGRSDERLQ